MSSTKYWGKTIPITIYIGKKNPCGSEDGFEYRFENFDYVIPYSTSNSVFQFKYFDVNTIKSTNPNCLIT